MRITNLLLLSLLMSLLLGACGGENGATTDTTGENTETTTTTDETASNPITPALPANEVGYVYGMILSKQFANPQIGFTDNEKNIAKIIEGIQAGFNSDQAAIVASVQVLKTRFGNPQANVPAQPPTTQEEADNIAYNLGINLIGNLKQIEIPATAFDYAAMKEGFEAMEAGNAKYNDAQMDSLFKVFIDPYQQAYQTKMQAQQAKMQAENEAKAAVAIEEGRKFLAENAKKEGVITLPSGMQYQVIKEGSGAKPTITDKVKTHYHGTLIDGSVFDSSVERGTPATFGVNQVIKGWQEGIPLMSVGAKYKFFIPQEMAYGMRAPSPKIPAGSTLIFDVELIEINPAS